jgi:hypothetical protein
VPSTGVTRERRWRGWRAAGSDGLIDGRVDDDLGDLAAADGHHFAMRRRFAPVGGHVGVKDQHVPLLTGVADVEQLGGDAVLECTTDERTGLPAQAPRSSSMSLAASPNVHTRRSLPFMNRIRPYRAAIRRFQAGDTLL